MTARRYSGYTGGAVPSFPVTALRREELRNGIVVRMPNWLGDAVMALPALRQLKALVPEDGALGVIVPVPLTPLFQSLPWLEIILPLAEPHRWWGRDERFLVRRCAFGAGLLHALAADMAPQDAVDYAIAASVLKLTIRGDSNLVTADEIAAVAGRGSGTRVAR